MGLETGLYLDEFDEWVSYLPASWLKEKEGEREREEKRRSRQLYHCAMARGKDTRTKNDRVLGKSRRWTTTSFLVSFYGVSPSSFVFSGFLLCLFVLFVCCFVVVAVWQCVKRQGERKGIQDQLGQKGRTHPPMAGSE